MNGLSLALLGAVSVFYDGRPLERFRTNRVRALLYYLATESVLGTSSFRREALMELLWPGLPLQSAQANLRQTLYHLRQAIPDMPAEAGDGVNHFLLSDRQIVRINPDYPVESDLARFNRFLDGSIEQRIDATELYRGDFLADFYLVDSAAYESWIAQRRAAFRRQVLKAMTDLSTFHTERGAYNEAEGFARRQLELDNLRESAYRQLMEALALSGRRSEALSEFDACRLVLQKELGVEPSAETLSLLEKIRTQQIAADVHERLPADYAVLINIEEVGDELKSEARPFLPDILLPNDPEGRLRHNLPPQPGRFLGRETELAELDGFIADPEIRLITIVGPGGIGKTRLALEAAERQLAKELTLAEQGVLQGDPSTDAEVLEQTGDQGPLFTDGVYFVSLAELMSVDQMIYSIGETLDIYGQLGEQQARSPERQVLDYLERKQLLFILDNFEHLLNGAEFLGQLMKNATKVQIIATSRERLHLRQEQIYPIYGLGYFHRDDHESLNDSVVLESPAARLFIQSARRIQPEFELSIEDIDDFMSICSLVEGMPLALELAASWVAVLSIREISSEIRRSLDFLETSEHDVPRRQRSMRALFESVWIRLSEMERYVFARLSVFRGGFTRQASTAVTGASIRQLATLVDKSLLHYDSQGGRYQIHELLRQYGAEKLAQDPSDLNRARDEHCAYFCEWLRNKEPKLTGAGQQTVLSEIEVDGENAQMAWYRAISNGDLPELYRSVDSLALYSKMSGRYQEAEQATHKAGDVLRTAMIDIDGADLIFEPSDESLLLATKLLSRVLTWQAVFQDGLGNNEEAKRLIEESLALLDNPELTGSDVRRERAFAKRNHGWAIRDHDPQLSTRLLREGLALSRELGDQRQLAQVLNDLGNQARFRGDYIEAEQLFEECLDIQTRLEDSAGIARVLLGLGWVALHQGKLMEGERLVRKGCETLFDIGGWVQVSIGLIALGFCHMNLGQYADARSSIQRSVDILEYKVDKPYLALMTIHLGQCMTHLGLYDEAYETGKRGFALSEGIGALATLEMGHMNLSFMALGVESYGEAERLARRSFAVYREKGNKARAAISLSFLGNALRHLGKVGESQRILLEAIQIATEIRDIRPLLFGITTIALHLVDEGEVEWAIELYTLAVEEPKVANSKWWHDAVGRHIESASATLSPEIVDAARSRGRSLDFWRTGTKLPDELMARGWERPSTTD